MSRNYSHFLRIQDLSQQRPKDHFYIQNCVSCCFRYNFPFQTDESLKIDFLGIEIHSFIQKTLVIPNCNLITLHLILSLIYYCYSFSPLLDLTPRLTLSPPIYLQLLFAHFTFLEFHFQVVHVHYQKFLSLSKCLKLHQKDHNFTTLELPFLKTVQLYQ